MHPAEACYDAPRRRSIAGKTRTSGPVRAAVHRRICEVAALLRDED
jgi:hypothetical protein